MRRILAVLAFCFSFSNSAWAEDFLGAPLPPGGKVVSKTESRLEIQYPISHDQILEFYRQHFKENKDIRYRDWKLETYIEDDGALPWHSIRISKGLGETRVTVAKDSWTWILGTLLLRFIGVFVVLLFLYAGMSVAGRLLSKVAASS